MGNRCILLLWRAGQFDPRCRSGKIFYIYLIMTQYCKQQTDGTWSDPSDLPTELQRYSTDIVTLSANGWYPYYDIPQPYYHVYTQRITKTLILKDNLVMPKWTITSHSVKEMDDGSDWYKQFDTEKMPKPDPRNKILTEVYYKLYPRVQPVSTGTINF